MADEISGGDPLEYLSTDLLSFRENGPDFRWIDTVRFRATVEMDAESLLLALIRNPWYEHTYTSPRNSAPSSTGDIHGPYQLHLISPSRFTRVESVQARKKVIRWSNQGGSLPPTLRDRIVDLLSSTLSDQTEVFELPDLGVDAWHEWGGVVGGDAFLEFVALDRELQLVTLLVASDD